MGQVIDLAARRAARLEEAAQAAIFHPALRWTLPGTPGTAHRRTARDITACGAGGPLRVALSGTPLCADCYPRASSS